MAAETPAGTAAARLVNPALARMRAGEPALGMIVRLARSGEIAHIARAAGHDFLFIDRQHGTASLETVAAIALAALGAGVAPLVRVRGPDDPDILRLLDAGALGIVVPDVSTPEAARAAVAACRYPPAGRRSAGSGFAALGFRQVGMAEAAPAIDAATMVVCMIETREGVRNLEAIAAVEGVDVLHLGCNDLLAELGRPGAFDAAELAGVKDRLLAACRSAGRFAGIGGDKDPARQRAAIARGYRFVTTQSDIALLTAAAAARAADLRRPAGADER